MTYGVGRDLTIDQLRSEHESGEATDPLFWYREQMAHFGEAMLNADARIIEPTAALPSMVWCRGDSPWKRPGGAVVSAAKAKRLAAGASPDLALWAKPKRVRDELRIYVDGDNVCARVCRPKWVYGAHITPMQFSSAIRDRIASARERIDRFVLDVTGDDALVIELNPYDASGLYGGELPWEST